MIKNNLSNFNLILKKNFKVYPKSEFLLRFDGCSKGNPGLAGAGAVIYHNEKEIWCGSQFIGHNESNNYAEYMGLIVGLKKAIRFGITELDVEGDSMVVIKQMNGEYKVNSKNLMDLYLKAQELKTNFDYISFTHIYRENNSRADELCNEAINNATLF
jgi:ribonuclease HI